MNDGESYVVRTPEQVFFRYELAGPIERGLAWLLDGVVSVGLTMAIVSALSPAGAFGGPLLYVFLFVVQWGYYVFFEWRWNGSSPGKRVMGLRVIQASGVHCPIERIVLRNFLRVVDSLPLLYLLGTVTTLILAPVSSVKSGPRRCKGSATCGPTKVKILISTPSKGLS